MGPGPGGDARRSKPDIILVSVSAYGQTGPYREKPGYARIAHGFAGLSLPRRASPTAARGAGGFGAGGLHGRPVCARWARCWRWSGATASAAASRWTSSLYEGVFRMLDDLAPVYAKLGRRARPHGRRSAQRGAAQQLPHARRQVGGARLLQRPDVRAAAAGDGPARPAGGASRKSTRACAAAPRSTASSPTGSHASTATSWCGCAASGDVPLGPHQHHRGHLRRPARARARQPAVVRGRGRANGRWWCPVCSRTCARRPDGSIAWAARMGEDNARGLWPAARAGRGELRTLHEQGVI